MKPAKKPSSREELRFDGDMAAGKNLSVHWLIFSTPETRKKLRLKLEFYHTLFVKEIETEPKILEMSPEVNFLKELLAALNADLKRFLSADQIAWLEHSRYQALIKAVHDTLITLKKP